MPLMLVLVLLAACGRGPQMPCPNVQGQGDQPGQQRTCGVRK